jgi:hypothetical protein
MLLVQDVDHAPVHGGHHQTHTTMNKNHVLKSMLVAASLALGSAVLARADDSVIAASPAPADSTLSLLGQKFGTLTYSYINLDDTSVHADNYTFEINQPLSFGLDGVFAYDYTRSEAVAGSRVRQHALTAALRAFSGGLNWGKPYVEAGVGHAWQRFGGVRDNSFLWEVGAGAELQVTSRAVVTPYVQYVDAPDLAGDGAFNFGVKASYWVDSQWAVTAGFETDDEQNTAVTVGTNFRF